MRRSDHPAVRPKRSFSFGRLRAAPLPELVHRDFVDMLFGMRVPVVGLGLVFVVVTGLFAREWRDPFLLGLAAAGAIVTAVRYGLMTAYQRAHPIERTSDLIRWERAYGAGNYAFAALLALLNVRALGYDEPLAQLISISLVFSFCAGIVARISVRPILCSVSVLLATVPTVAALAIHASLVRDQAFHAELLAIEAILMAMIAALSLQTLAHLYRSAVQHHTSRHDLGRMAKHDALTGLANRLLLREAFRRSSQRTFQDGGQLALLFIDLDGFKAINDNFGHPTGDFVLQQVAKRLEAMVRQTDVVARLGGDEFVILQARVIDASEAELLGRRVIKRISETYELDGQDYWISASVGIAMAPECGNELEMLLSAADAALYRSKAAGKRTVTFAKPRISADRRPVVQGPDAAARCGEAAARTIPIRAVVPWFPAPQPPVPRKVAVIRYEKRFWTLAACLAGLAGYVDAVGFIKLGGFFVSFMSGNSTRLAVGAVTNPRVAAVAAGLLGAFVLGVMAGSFVAAAARYRRKAAVLMLVSALLAVAAILEGRSAGRWPALLMAAAMGAENGVFQRDGEVSIALTYMTGTLVKFGQRVAAALTGGSRWGWLPYLILWCSLTGGAAIGTIVYSRSGSIAIWAAAVAALLLAGYAATIRPIDPGKRAGVRI